MTVTITDTVTGTALFGLGPDCSCGADGDHRHVQVYRSGGHSWGVRVVDYWKGRGGRWCAALGRPRYFPTWAQASRAAERWRDRIEASR